MHDIVRKISGFIFYKIILEDCCGICHSLLISLIVLKVAQHVHHICYWLLRELHASGVSLFCLL